MRHIISDLRGNPVYTSFGSWRSRGSTSRNNSTHHNPRSILFLHVKASDWNSVILRAKSHPAEILMFDDNGNTPLHIACQLDPPIEVLISLKDAVSLTNSWGATPLHIAASHRCNVQALKKLIDYFPGALCRLSKMHRTPIHYACMSYRGLDLVAFKVLVERTIKESHRLKEEQQQQLEYQEHESGDKEILECDSKISNFINILREEKDDTEGDDILDDEEISVLIDTDSQHADSPSLQPAVSARLISFNQATEEENSTFGPNKNNYNIVTWKDTSGKTPLALLFRRYRERVKRVIDILEQMKSFSNNNPSSSSSLQTDLGHLWGKARLIVVLLAQEYQQQQQTQLDLQGKLSSYLNSLHAGEKMSNKEKRDDDSSASGKHWSQAASWSKERLSNRHAEEYSNVIKVGNNCDEKKIISTEERQIRIVHASVGLIGYGCPPEMIRLAISIYPHQVREMDDNGNLPLHIAATASSIGTVTTNNFVEDEESSVFSESIVSLFSTMSSKKYGDNNCHHGAFDKVIKLLLKQYPQAAQTPHGRSGRLPLVLADRVGNRTWNDGMKTLLRAYPPALFSGSRGVIPVKLYPNILSLIGGGNPSESSVTKCASFSNFSSASTVSSFQRSACNSRFKGRGGIGLLNNLLLLKQRHMKELMAGTSRVYDSPQIRRIQPEKKKLKALATTMFELLRAKPDLIEASRSHKPFLESTLGKVRLYDCKKSMAWGAYTPNSTKENTYSDGSEACGNQKFSRGRKKVTSGKLMERMKVFERKPWKSV